MNGKERIASALAVGLIALTGCRPADAGNQTRMPQTNITRSTDLATLKPAEQTKDNLKKEILTFSWKDAENSDKLKKFIDDLASGYLELTHTPRLNKEDLVGKGKTTFYSDSSSYVDAIRKFEPQFSPSPTNWGYTHYPSKKVLINLESIKKQAEAIGPAGLTITTATWHELGHLDVAERITGEFLNNPKFYFHSPISNVDEQFKKYRGGAIYTDTYYSFTRFEEVLNETITARRIIGLLGADANIAVSADYYKNGVDFFSKFTDAYIPLETLYQLHATSDLEGLAKLAGKNLPGEKDPVIKGLVLFRGIHEANADLIKETGVFEQIPK